MRGKSHARCGGGEKLEECLVIKSIDNQLLGAYLCLYYAGDGTVQTDVVGIVESWDVSGTYDATDAAQALIAGLKRQTGAGRKVWHKIVDSNNTEEVVGVATALNIVAGSGAAEEHEEFSATLQFNQMPEVRSI